MVVLIHIVEYIDLVEGIVPMVVTSSDILKHIVVGTILKEATSSVALEHIIKEFAKASNHGTVEVIQIILVYTMVTIEPSTRVYR